MKKLQKLLKRLWKQLVKKEEDKILDNLTRAIMWIVLSLLFQALGHSTANPHHAALHGFSSGMALIIGLKLLLG